MFLVWSTKPTERWGQLNCIRYSNVDFSYSESNQLAISGVSFQIDKGQTIAFVGGSGSGKSTIVKLLIGLFNPVEGAIFYNDLEHNEIDYNEIRQYLGLVSQDLQLFSGTIKENMLFANPDATDEMIIQALNSACRQKIIACAQDGVNSMLGESGLNLSGGERQSLCIARALVRDPSYAT